METALNAIRHSCAHLLAEAVQERFAPEGPVYLAGGPAIDDGFYYDFGLPRAVGEADLAWLEQRLRELIARDVSFVCEVQSAQALKELFASQPYKLETLADLEGGPAPLTIYRHAAFVDLCEGPHVARSSEIAAAAIKLVAVAGAYWRGDEQRPMLTRIYGTAWRTVDELAAYLERRAEAERRDHRRIGRDLELFFFHPTAPGMPYWLPHGLTVLNELIAFWRAEHGAEGYQEIASPLLNHKCLWETSGHWEHYRSDMFLMDMGEGQVFGLKPMNCPNAMLVFNHKQRSYRDLPLRLSDCDILHRHERSGSLHGLLRVQKIQQDDAHIFVAPPQIGAEFDRILALVGRFYRLFGLEFSYRLGTRPGSFLGDVESWDLAEAALTEVLDRHAGKGAYEIAPKDGAFYGPKIDILMRDALGRRWQMGTLQLDFQLPRRFGCAYVDSAGERQAPVVIHRVVYGSLERFIGILLEHTGGALPPWLAPIQARILPVSDDHAPAAAAVAARLRAAHLRVEVASDDTVGARIRAAALAKVPWIMVIGAREVRDGSVSLRCRGNRTAVALSVDAATQRLAAAVRDRLDAP